MFCEGCGESIESGSNFCRFCGAKQGETAAILATPSSPAPQLPAKPGTTKWVAAILGCAVLIIAVPLLLSGGPSTAPVAPTAMNTSAALEDALTNAATPGDATPAAGAAPALANNWTYSTDEDKVRGGTTYFATTTSTNTVHQDPPYDSDTAMTLTVRRSPSSGLNIVLRISSGQMMCPSYEGCSGTIRFDNGPAQRVRFAGPADSSSDTIFLEGEKAFLAKLRGAKHLVVEKTLYEAGAPQFEFDVSGLKWAH